MTLQAAPIVVANAEGLRTALSRSPDGSVIQLKTGEYPGSFTVSKINITLEPVPGDLPRLVGGAFPVGAKTPWLRIAASAQGAIVRNLPFVREGDVTKRGAYKDLGIISEADKAEITGCQFVGMNIGLNVKESSLGTTVTHNTFGPTYQSNMVVASSNGVVRGLLIAWNIFEKSYIEDGIQFQPFSFGDVHGPEHQEDLSNRGTIIYQNEFRDLNENAIDLKGVYLAIIDGNTFTRTAGSVDGPVNGWNHNSPACIMRGANANSQMVVIRGNGLEENSGGIRVYTEYRVYHNKVLKNNYCPWDPTWQGWGISQIEQTGSFIKNNHVAAHKSFNVDAKSGAECNPSQPGPGVALTATRGGGVGRVLNLVDAKYFTDWFGRDGLPPDVLYMDDKPYLVQSVDYINNTVTLDKEVTWTDGRPVFWRSPTPVVGIQEPEPPVVVVPEPPVDPPIPDQVVSLAIEVSMSPAEAKIFRGIMANKTVTITVSPAAQG